MPAPALQPAFVLHTRRYRDTSLIVECFTRDQGRVAVVARGAATSKRQVPLQPFSPLLLAWRGRGEIQTLTHAEAAGPPLPLSGRALFCGMYLNELLLRLSARHDTQVEVFAAYARALTDLTGSMPQDAVLRGFEVSLLEYMGLGLPIDLDQSGAPIEATAHYQFDPVGGACVVAAATRGSVSGECLLALASGTFDNPQVRLEARTMMRRVIDHHLGGQPLMSRELFR